jgi:DNA polymerase-1
MGEVARRSINTKIQGSAADIMKKAMIDLYNIIKKRNDGAYILIQVHDEIVMEAPEEYADDYRVILQNCMENAVKLRVPLIAEAVIGNTWGEAK